VFDTERPPEYAEGPMTLSIELIAELETLIRRDPARRGLIGREDESPPLCPGHLSASASHLAQFGSHVAIVTGFYVPHGTPPAAETDGPPGSLQLAFALEAARIATTIVTDDHCASAVYAAADAAGYARDRVFIAPRDHSNWVADFFTAGPGAALSHLVSVERVGPSHTLESIACQNLCEDSLARFKSEVSPEAHDCCHNMRGTIIDEYTGGLHELFDAAPRLRPEMKTIGIGDGGNEIGMGGIPWDELARRLDGDWAVRIPCRIATDWTIIAGTSNWGACALGAAVAALRGCADELRECDARQHQHLLETMVQLGPAVDGVTGRQQATVDGLPFLTYIQPWEGIRRALGFHV
jgi:hypothetical protein